MIYITSENELDKIMRDFLIQQSQIPEKFVRAQHSLYGTDLTKNRGDIFESIKHSDLLILFEVHSTGSIESISETQSDGLKHFSYFEVNVIIYGDASTILANKLTARLRSEPVRDDALSKGIQIVNVGNQVELKEFKNGVVWVRNDFNMNIACTMLIENIIDPNQAETISEIQIQTY